MAKPRKVVPIAEATSKLIAQDEKTQRIILGIGSERIAIDRLVRITKLPPHTGDEPATLLPIKKKPARVKSRVTKPRVD